MWINNKSVNGSMKCVMTLLLNCDLLSHKFHGKPIFPNPRIQLYAQDLSGFPALFTPSSQAGPGFQTPGHLLSPFSTPFQSLLSPQISWTLFYLQVQSKIKTFSRETSTQEKYLLALLCPHSNPNFNHSCIHVVVHSFLSQILYVNYTSTLKI